MTWIRVNPEAGLAVPPRVIAMNEELIRKLLATIECGTCGQPYDEQDIYVLGHRDDLWFLGILCPACHSQSLVAATVKGGELAEVYAELTEEDLAESSQGETVRADDVLDMHDFLREFDGDFAALFTGR